MEAAAASPGRVNEFMESMDNYSSNLLGYPVNQQFWQSGELDDTLLAAQKFLINNCGDPFTDSASYQMHSKEFEREVQSLCVSVSVLVFIFRCLGLSMLVDVHVLLLEGADLLCHPTRQVTNGIFWLSRLFLFA